MSHPAEPTAIHDAAHEHEHGGTGVYAKTLIALLILTAITVAAASFDFGQGNVVIALFIATIKASLVVLFFMHLRWDKPVNAIIAMAGFLFLGIFILFCLLDFDARNNYLPSNLHAVADVPLAPGTAPAGEVLHTNPAAAAEGGEKK
ncbi:MAG TPA: cytochrome C oxidase subunit IV family protein [Bryobacteraceae bacterium]|nr:cytochrome C oxidase subunit IV family protein [Bryobacteraceae bacterium]